MKNLKIKKASKQNLKDLVNLTNIVRFKTYDIENYVTFEEYIKQEGLRTESRVDKLKNDLSDKNKKILVALLDTKLIGYIKAQKKNNYSQINSLFILPEYQGLHIGTILIQKILYWLKNESKLILLVADNNQRAIAFYQKFGFILDYNEAKKGKYVTRLQMVYKKST